MRNKDYEDDQKVFSYINKGESDYFQDLINFLVTNNLPLKESWAFYFLGFHKLIDKSGIESMNINARDHYGGKVYPEIYYWERHLLDETSIKNEIESELRENNQEVSPEIIQKLFIQKGWSQGDERADADRMFVANRWADEEMDFIHSQIRYEELPEEKFCESCQSSPCMCSDREQSSMATEY